MAYDKDFLSFIVNDMENDMKTFSPFETAMNRYVFDEDEFEKLDSYIKEQVQENQNAREWILDNFVPTRRSYSSTDPTEQKQISRVRYLRELLYRTIEMLQMHQDLLTEVIQPEIEEYSKPNNQWMNACLVEANEDISAAIEAITEVCRELHNEKSKKSDD